MRHESVIQREIRKSLAQVGLQAIHVPNGAVLAGDPQQRGKQMNALKADGLYPGFPDLLVYGSGGRIGHIEVKAPTGRQNDNQKHCEAWMRAWGHHYAVCRSGGEAIDAVKAWGWL